MHDVCAGPGVFGDEQRAPHLSISDCSSGKCDVKGILKRGAFYDCCNGRLCINESLAGQSSYSGVEPDLFTYVVYVVSIP